QERGREQRAQRESSSQNKIEHKETERRVAPTAQRQGVRPKSLPGHGRKALGLPKSSALVKINQHKRHQKRTSGKGRAKAVIGNRVARGDIDHRAVNKDATWKADDQRSFEGFHRG